MERAPFLPRPPHRPVWVNNRGRLLEGSCQVGTRLLSLFSCFYHPVVLLLAVSEPTRTWVFMVLDVVSRTETHQSPIRIKSRKVGWATRPSVPGTPCPRKPSVPNRCPSGRSTNRVTAVRCMTTHLVPTPSWLRVGATQFLPWAGAKSETSEKINLSPFC